MAFMDWMKRNNGANEAPEQRYLTHDERWALRRMIGHFDEVGHKLNGDAQKTLEKMSERLTLRLRDPFGDRPTAISQKEAEALGQFQKVCERESDIYPGNDRMQSDTCSIRDALDRGEEKFQTQSQGAGKTIRRPAPSWER